MALVATASALLAPLAERARAEDWPCWRGPHRDGISREVGLLKERSRDGPRQLWKADLGCGFSSVAVADGHLIVLGDHGKLGLAGASPLKYTPVSRRQLLDRDKLTWTVQVLSGGRLFVRHPYGLVALEVAGQGK